MVHGARRLRPTGARRRAFSPGVAAKNQRRDLRNGWMIHREVKPSVPACAVSITALTPLAGDPETEKIESRGTWLITVLNRQPRTRVEQVRGTLPPAHIWCDPVAALERAKERVPAFDLDRFLAVVAAFVDETQFDQGPHNAGIGFIQNAHDVADGQMVVGEEIANRRLALKGRIQTGSVGGHHERLGS